MVREVFRGNNNYMKSGTNLRPSLFVIAEGNPQRHEGNHDGTAHMMLQVVFDDDKRGVNMTSQFACGNDKSGKPRCCSIPSTRDGFLTGAVEALKGQAGSVEERQSIAENLRGFPIAIGRKPLPYVLASR